MSQGKPFRELPKVDLLANHPALAEFSPAVRTAAARHAIDERRRLIAVGREAEEPIEETARREAAMMARPSQRPVINMTGVVLHTGLGRARLASEAVEALATGGRYSNLELDLGHGKRGERLDHVRGLLCALTGAEDALVVNNAAAGLFLSLVALAAGREVVLSRGQMVEIGGSFRLPDIVEQSGCRLVEVGATNRTRLVDYQNALTDRTAAILRCHPSNFAIVGFTEDVAPEALAGLADEHSVVFLDDQGSGLLLDTTRFGLPRLPRVQDSLSAGAHLVVASGDKLLGGPQAGLVLGRSALVEAVRRHPLYRAVRIDKSSLAALEATLRLYRDNRELEIPTWRSIARSLQDVLADARQLAAAWTGAFVSPGITEVGSGSAPGVGVPTYRVSLPGDAETVLRRLRMAKPSVIGRIEDGCVWLDVRTVEPSELEAVCELGRGWK